MINLKGVSGAKTNGLVFKQTVTHYENSGTQSDTYTVNHNTGTFITNIKVAFTHAGSGNYITVVGNYFTDAFNRYNGVDHSNHVNLNQTNILLYTLAGASPGTELEVTFYLYSEGEKAP